MSRTPQDEPFKLNISEEEIDAICARVKVRLDEILDDEPSPDRWDIIAEIHDNLKRIRQHLSCAERRVSIIEQWIEELD